jgi:hypothetical protein
LDVSAHEVYLSNGKRLPLTRDQILAYRLEASSLNARLPAGSASLEQAAWAGLQDSMPRAALLSLHARVAGVESRSWEDPALLQVWGPRYSVYVVAARDLPLFTVSRYPDDARGRRTVDDMTAQLKAHMGKKRMRFDDAASFVVGDANRIRYATVSGTLAIRWEGARQPEVWRLPRPTMSVADARREVARRHLHVFGPASAGSFATWLGIKDGPAAATYAELVAANELIPVATPIGEAYILAADEASYRAARRQPAAARLLPSGDTFYLAWGANRELLVPDAANRERLWTTRVWPGALLVRGEIVGTWRRDQHTVTASSWRRLSPADRAAVEEEAASLPLPALAKRVAVTWEP